MRPRRGGQALGEVFRRPGPLRAGAEEDGDVLAVLPTLFHLLWTGVLRVDLHTCLLSSGIMVHTADGSDAVLESGVGTRGVLADRGRGMDGGRNEMSELSRPASIGVGERVRFAGQVRAARRVRKDGDAGRRRGTHA